MFCSKCGNEVKDGQKFCGRCGEPVDTGNPVDATPQEGVTEMLQNPGMAGNTEAPGMPKKSVGRKILKRAVPIAGTAILAVIIFFGVQLLVLNQKFKSISAHIDTYNVLSAQQDKESLAESWAEAGFFSFGEKREILQRLQTVSEEASAAQAWLMKEAAPTVEEWLAGKEEQHLAEGFAAYEEILLQCDEAIKANDDRKAEKLFEEAEEALEALKEENARFVEEKLATYTNINMSMADKEDKDLYTQNMDKISQLDSQGKYGSMAMVFEELDNIAYRYIEPERRLNVSIQQVDASDYPHIRLYTQLVDTSTNDVPEGLDQALFFVRKQDANANYIKQQVVKITQLDEIEALNVEMVADVSGSMFGDPLNEAKQIMSDFVSSVQFAAGDKVELVSFSTGVQIEETFTGSADVLKSRISGLVTGDMTSLYDALYAGVSRVAAQRGAKCVIAFTDGLDNYSSCSAGDVIDIAQRYHVPVFIIGIGTMNDAEIRNVAVQTGGFYYNVRDVNSMWEIYQEIYKQEKELYLIEFEDADGVVTEDANIVVGYHSPVYGGECTYTYRPNVLLSVSGAGIYHDGPEAVVEAYMRGFADAMTNSDFSCISDYLKDGSNIYNSQKAYVSRDIRETLDSYEIVSVDYSDSANCVVTTRETYYVQVEDKPLELLTQQCKYQVVYENNRWYMTDFADKVDVLSRVNH